MLLTTSPLLARLRATAPFSSGRPNPIAVSSLATERVEELYKKNKGLTSKLIKQSNRLIKQLERSENREQMLSEDLGRRCSALTFTPYDDRFSNLTDAELYSEIYKRQISISSTEYQALDIQRGLRALKELSDMKKSLKKDYSELTLLLQENKKRFEELLISKKNASKPYDNEEEISKLDNSQLRDHFDKINIQIKKLQKLRDDKASAPGEKQACDQKIKEKEAQRKSYEKEMTKRAMNFSRASQTSEEPKSSTNSTADYIDKAIITLIVMIIATSCAVIAMIAKSCAVIAMIANDIFNNISISERSNSSLGKIAPQETSSPSEIRYLHEVSHEIRSKAEVIFNEAQDRVINGSPIPNELRVIEQEMQQVLGKAMPQVENILNLRKVNFPQTKGV